MSITSVTRLLEQSQWVIQGTVRKLAATTMPEVPASDHTFVVRVDGILHGPPAFADHLKRDITVYSDKPARLKTGSKAVFFTRSWMYGRSVAVIEVGRIVDEDRKTMANDIQGAEAALFDRRLGDRLAKAALVVVGRVADNREGPKLRRPIETEHAPVWAEALVDVRELLKGKSDQQRLPVFYPRSTDEMWIESPKLLPGLTAILILQRNQQEKGWPLLRVPGLTALDPLDVQPVEMLDRIRQLLKTGGRK